MSFKFTTKYLTPVGSILFHITVECMQVFSKFLSRRIEIENAEDKDKVRPSSLASLVITADPP